MLALCAGYLVVGYLFVGCWLLVAVYKYSPINHGFGLAETLRPDDYFFHRRTGMLHSGILHVRLLFRNYRTSSNLQPEPGA